MKRVLVLLLACLASSVMFGQTQTFHYQVNNTGVVNGNLKITCTITVDGEQIYNGDQSLGGGQLEIGVFDQDGECRCAKFPTWRSKSSQWIYQLQIKGNPGYTYSFRVYDHNTETELDLVDDLDEVITFQAGGIIGSSTDPYLLNFTHPSSGITMHITGYEPEDHWYFLSSPIGGIDISETNISNMVTDGITFDFYSFDQNGDAEGKEWLNYEFGSFNRMEAGRAYLYASQDDRDIVFHGDAYDGDGEFDLVYNAEADLPGYNLMGNPFNSQATVNWTRPFFRMNGAELLLEQPDYVLEPMEGILLVAEEGEETVTFVPSTSGGKSAGLVLNVSNGRNLVDRAIVLFNQSRPLPKFQLHRESTKVYFPVDGQDYAAVSTEGMGELPVSFKAESNGSYTFNFAAQEVTFGYLHLIDNKTGADIDLLQSQSYTFNALTTDYANRFKLVFATGDNGNENFAFFSNGSFIINNEGEATLQVVDVTGRILNNETINGCANVNINAAPGVYMIRLINGENVRVQKVVVR